MLIPFEKIVRKYGKPKGILHVGANIGEECEAYTKVGIEKVIWIEANPSLIPKSRYELLCPALREPRPSK